MSGSTGRTFLTALVAVAIAFVAIGGLIAAYGTGRDRPEGAAEQWLNDVADTTRKGVAADAQDRVAEHGSPIVAAQLLPDVDVHGKSAFSALEVGKATSSPYGIRVPFLVTRREHGPYEDESVEGTLVLEKEGGAWRVVSLADRAPGERLPSEGGEAIAKAPLAVYAGAVGVGALITVAIALGMARLREPAVTVT